MDMLTAHACNKLLYLLCCAVTLALDYIRLLAIWQSKLSNALLSLTLRAGLTSGNNLSSQQPPRLDMHHRVSGVSRNQVLPTQASDYLFSHSIFPTNNR